MRGYRIYKDGGLQYEMKHLLTCQHEKGNVNNHFAANAAIAAMLTSLFTALIIADGTSRNSRPSGVGKTTCGDGKDALKYLNKFS